MKHKSQVLMVKLLNIHCQHLHFNGHFQNKVGYSLPLSFIPSLVPDENLLDNQKFFCGPDALL